VAKKDCSLAILYKVLGLDIFSSKYRREKKPSHKGKEKKGEGEDDEGSNADLGSGEEQQTQKSPLKPNENVLSSNTTTSTTTSSKNYKEALL
ncbi:hypothetical protein HK096_001807, partial [Nowakowskiella sp. JEL0078]